MAAPVACIAGQEIHRQCQTGRIQARSLGRRDTPFGPSGEVFAAAGADPPAYLLARYGTGRDKPAPARVNHRANLYALKDLGVERVLAWGAGAAITHTVAIGDLVLLTDVIDMTHLRARTFFEDSPLGFLRQFPVFCPALHEVVHGVLDQRQLGHVAGAVAAVREGPRLETAAEVRMLATLGAEIVTHAFVPEVFLARELEMCYAGICYVVKYAESGSRHRPFIPGALFGGPREGGEGDRARRGVGEMCDVVADVAAATASSERDCPCARAMARHVKEYGLSRDWREWFA